MRGVGFTQSRSGLGVRGPGFQVILWSLNGKGERRDVGHKRGVKSLESTKGPSQEYRENLWILRDGGYRLLTGISGPVRTGGCLTCKTPPVPTLDRRIWVPSRTNIHLCPVYSQVRPRSLLGPTGSKTRPFESTNGWTSPCLPGRWTRFPVSFPHRKCRRRTHAGPLHRLGGGTESK